MNRLDNIFRINDINTPDVFICTVRIVLSNLQGNTKYKMYFLSLRIGNK